MSKFSKLCKNPVRFFKDAYKNKYGSKASSKKRKQSLYSTVRKSDATDKKFVIPSWYAANDDAILQSAANSDLPVFLYTPWIKLHSDVLLDKLRRPDAYHLCSINIFSDLSSAEQRHQVVRFCRQNPALFRKMVLRRLIPLCGKVKGFVFTLDWPAPMKIISNVCEELGIPRILVPHESVFMAQDMYYVDTHALTSLPSADVILGWGALQRDIFLNRGYPPERFQIIGAPKFDVHVAYKPYIDRNTYARLYGLRADKKILLFAAQPMDSQLDATEARAAQRKAITDLFDYAELRGYQVLVRCPPSDFDIFSPEMRERIEKSFFIAVDEASCFITTPEEALYHCDAVLSVNSTMLFEGALMGRPALSIKYIPFDQIWIKAGISAAYNPKELVAHLDKLLTQVTYRLPAEGRAWAERSFTMNGFDGKASQRAQNYLQDLAEGKTKLEMRRNAAEELIQNPDGIVDVIAICATQKDQQSTQKYVPQLLGARNVLDIGGHNQSKKYFNGIDLFVEWGLRDSKRKNNYYSLYKNLGRPHIIIENGFIRSLDLGVNDAPALSLILDDLTAYYNALEPSRLEILLNAPQKLTTEEAQRAKSLIARITNQRLSKYNHAPLNSADIGAGERPKILLVDQRYEDQSIVYGMANEASFKAMIEDAIQEFPGHDILIKRHPDALHGAKQSYYNDSFVKPYLSDRVHLIDYDINPYTLIESVERVFVATSGMGFEALMAGKPVRCYGAPFYAGWGVTEDKIVLARRQNKREVYEIFHFAYIALSRYIHPDLLQRVQIETILDYLAVRVPHAKDIIEPPTKIDETLSAAIAARRNERYIEAVQYLETILLYQPDCYDAHLELSRLYSRVNNLALAQKNHELYIEKNPKTQNIAPYLLSRQDISQVTTTCAARDLLTAERFDIVVKYLYGRALMIGRNIPYYEKLYERHIQQRTGGYERPLFWNPNANATCAKQSVNDYKNAYNTLLQSIQNEGFRKSLWIPLGKGNIPLDGAHRIAASLVYGKSLHAVKLPGLKSSKWDYQWFQNAGFDQNDLDKIVQTFVQLKNENCRLFMAWAPCFPYLEKVEKVLLQHLKIAAQKEISFDAARLPEVVFDIYAHDLGADVSKRKNIRDKIERLQAYAPTIKLYVCCGKNEDAYQAAKNAVREALADKIPVEHYVTVHCTDNAAHTLLLTEQLFNGNNDRLGDLRAAYKPDPAFEKKLMHYRETLAARGIPIDRTAIIGSAALVAMGVKSNCDDIDFIMDTVLRKAMGLPDTVTKLSDVADLVKINYHARSGVAAPLSDDDIIDEPKNFFYCRGVKFANLEIVADNKRNGKREKDQKDAALIEQFFNAHVMQECA